MKTLNLKIKQSLIFYFLLASSYLIAQTTYTAYNNWKVFTDMEITNNFVEDTFMVSEETNDWGPWGNDDCFAGIDYRVKKGDFNNYSKQWYWYVQFRNRYNNQVHFSYAVAEPGTRPEPDHRSKMGANSESDSTGFLLYSGNQVRVRVGYIRFGYDDSGGYATCDK